MGRKIGDPSAAALEAAVPPNATDVAGDPEQAENAERRRKTRVPLDIPLMMSIYQWEGDGGFRGQSVHGRLLDLSEDGLLIESEFPLEKDMFIVIHFQQESQLPPMTARIIRIDRSKGAFQYGCLLSGLPLYQRLQLQEYIAGRN
ncbi:PilZ domain-containing protein [Cohnella cellulosilytica]|uniref:PilZ domain-containing protein n=1 Tax=Cohnella cellulosilytica TaxID=986710 RepID=A0ABW2FIY0_9BACL